MLVSGYGAGSGSSPVPILQFVQYKKLKFLKMVNIHLTSFTFRNLLAFNLETFFLNSWLLIYFLILRLQIKTFYLYPGARPGTGTEAGAGVGFFPSSGSAKKWLIRLHNTCNDDYLGLCFRWAGEQAKKRELGDVVDFVRDLQLWTGEGKNLLAGQNVIL